MHTPFIFFILLIFSFVGAVKVSDDEIQYIGVSNETSGIDNFWGIRYAQAPTGDLRWRPPIPMLYVGSAATINATEKGPACPQNTASWESADLPFIPQSEDCLLLNIQRPIYRSSEKVPVMVGIHGGGYIRGSARDVPGDSLLHQANGSMILVSIQYRPGTLGFLAGDDLKRDGTRNVGLLDQRLALEWIRDNIHHFGGDSSKITISGGSAGGASVALQMVMGGGLDNAPFQAAIAEYAWWTPFYDDTRLNEQYDGFLHDTGCTTLKCLRKLPISEIQKATRSSLLKAYMSKQYAYGTFYWGPSIDGSIIQRHPLNEFRDGHFTKVPMLVDRNFLEGFTFSNYTLTSEDEALSDFAALWHDENKYYEKIAWGIYPESSCNASFINELPAAKYFTAMGLIKNKLSTAFFRRASLFGDALIGCPNKYIAEEVAKSGTPVYKMVFNSGMQFHAATWRFLYSNKTDADGSVSSGGVSNPGNATLARFIRSYFISFTLHHDPNMVSGIQKYAPSWPPYSLEGRQTIYLSNEDIRVIHDPDDSEKCQFLEMGRGNNVGVWPQW